MSLHKQAIDVVNRNVWATNILLIPALIYNIMIIRDINTWEIDASSTGRFLGSKPKFYESLWWCLAVLIVIVIVFSTLWHVFMFFSDSSVPFLKKMGALDYKFVAPLFTFVTILLNIIYIVFLNSKNTHTYDHSILYIVAAIFQIIGFTTYILKHFVYYPTYNRRGFLKKIKWAHAHTFFHYISYTGVSLLLSVFYLDNKEIFNTYFTNN